MKLSNETLTVLKNFGTINPNLIFPKGNTLATIAEAKNIMANAVITEKFKSEFGIYDVNEFLNVISLVGTDPDLEFSDGHVLISEGWVLSNISLCRCKHSYRSYEKVSRCPSADVTVNISQHEVLQLRHVRFASSWCSGTVWSVL